MSETLGKTVYSSLLHEVQELLEPETLQRGEVEGERVQRYWEVGRDMRMRLLYEMVSLYRLFPILPSTTRLGWSHYRMLLRVGSKRERTFYVEEAEVHTREFVCEALSASERVVVTTRHRDKYGRWLADLYYHPNWRDGKRILKRGRLLNGEMVGEGLAARYGG